MSAARCSTHHDGLHERSGLDGTDKLRGDQQHITVILSDAETAAPWRPAIRGSQLAEAGSDLQTDIPAPFVSVPYLSLSWILDMPERQRVYIYNTIQYSAHMLLRVVTRTVCVHCTSGQERYTAMNEATKSTARLIRLIRDRVGDAGLDDVAQTSSTAPASYTASPLVRQQQ